MAEKKEVLEMPQGVASQVETVENQVENQVEKQEFDWLNAKLQEKIEKLVSMDIKVGKTRIVKFEVTDHEVSPFATLTLTDAFRRIKTSDDTVTAIQSKTLNINWYQLLGAIKAAFGIDWTVVERVFIPKTRKGKVQKIDEETAEIVEVDDVITNVHNIPTAETIDMMNFALRGSTIYISTQDVKAEGDILNPYSGELTPSKRDTIINNAVWVELGTEAQNLLTLVANKKRQKIADRATALLDKLDI